MVLIADMSCGTTVGAEHRRWIRGGEAKVCSDLGDLQEHFDVFNRGSNTKDRVRPMDQSSKNLSRGGWEHSKRSTASDSPRR
jgi:hypothetical protein